MADASSGPGDSIYTVLVFVTLLTLLAGVGYTPDEIAALRARHVVA